MEVFAGGARNSATLCQIDNRQKIKRIWSASTMMDYGFQGQGELRLSLMILSSARSLITARMRLDGRPIDRCSFNFPRHESVSYLLQYIDTTSGSLVGSKNHLRTTIRLGFRDTHCSLLCYISIVAKQGQKKPQKAETRLLIDKWKDMLSRFLFFKIKQTVDLPIEGV